jgi:hypothetical protein
MPDASHTDAGDDGQCGCSKIVSWRADDPEMPPPARRRRRRRRSKHSIGITQQEFDARARTLKPRGIQRAAWTATILQGVTHKGSS